MSCFSGECPKYDFTTITKEQEKEDAKAKEDREKAIAIFQGIPLPYKPKTEVEKCQEYCREIAKAEAEKCRQIREKVERALKIAGCPSRVIPTAGKKKGCSAASKKTTAKTTTKSATKSGCASGLCSRK